MRLPLHTFSGCMILLLGLFCSDLKAQTSELKYGDHAVGFRIIKLVDSSRVFSNEIDRTGERYEGDRFRTIYVHLWYPTPVSTGKPMDTRQYIASQVMDDAADAPDTRAGLSMVHRTKKSMSRWFGSFTDENWDKLLDRPWKARINAPYPDRRYPLIMGELRPVSTFVTNEYLASHGFVVAHVRKHLEGFSRNTAGNSRMYADGIRDLQMATLALRKMGLADWEKLGTLGFSGSGFTQVHYAMTDADVDAIADIESGYFMEGLYESLITPSTFDLTQMRVPFLHIFSRKLSEEEIYIDSLYAMQYADVYRLILEKPQHHWDVASEGYLSARYLDNRPAVADEVIQSFHLFNEYLRQFFRATLEEDERALQFVRKSPTPNMVDTSLAKMEFRAAAYHSPTVAELIGIMENQGPDIAFEFVAKHLDSDAGLVLKSDLNALQGMGRFYQRRGEVAKTLGLAKIILLVSPGDESVRRFLDDLGYQLLDLGHSAEAEPVFQANIDHFPQHHIPHYSLGDLYLQQGNRKMAKTQFEKGLALLDANPDYPDQLRTAHRKAFEEKIEEAKQDK